MSHYRVSILSSARRDINSAVAYIVETLQNPTAAEALLNEIDNKIDKLKNGVWKGVPLKNHPSGLFEDIDMNWFPVKNHYLFFRVDEAEKAILIYYFTHKRQGLQHILSVEDSR
ncbi:MAG: type II toxin-antitoxin system RelE/ParE family toxin [Clostridiales Family XIII bacterium]|jgi:plasmid stabilization system protein ParE|nr:type II toxin-antitoxin system RelE/ParE family toxin [Clostridiales Family XIII bacterium]